MWLVGICKKCGFLVIEQMHIGDLFPFQTMCLNSKCEEHIWHKYEVTELGIITPEYMELIPNIEKRITIDRR
jgi:hypothetical protein